MYNAKIISFLYNGFLSGRMSDQVGLRSLIALRPVRTGCQSKFKSCSSRSDLLGHDEARDRRMTNDVFADTAEDRALDSSHSTTPEYYHLGLLFLGNATDSFSRVLVRLAAQFEMQLSQHRSNRAIYNIHH